MPSSSNVIAYEISQAQNSALTIEASADPIIVGGSVTIKGKLASVSTATPVKCSLTPATADFTAVAETSTSASGEYSFCRSPLQQHLLRGQGPAGRHSAVLYGVHDLLSVNPRDQCAAGAAADSSRAGVSAPAGHVIYLEARMPSAAASM